MSSMKLKSFVKRNNYKLLIFPSINNNNSKSPKRIYNPLRLTKATV